MVVAVASALGPLVAPSAAALFRFITGIAVIAIGVHMAIFRDRHSTFWGMRFNLVRYRPATVAFVGLGCILVGVIWAFATLPGLRRS